MARIPFLEQTIDLSHYDLIDTFTALEAACLIAGIDPNRQEVVELYGSPEFARMTVIEEAIKSDNESAGMDLLFMCGDDPASEIIYPPWYSTDSDGELIPRLPSIEQINDFQAYKHTKNEKYLQRSYNFHSQKFGRKELTDWISAKGYAQARYFVSAITARDNAANAQSEASRLQSENAQLRAKLEQAQAGQRATQQPQAIGLSFRHETELLKLVAAVQDRYLGDNYDPGDTDTRPRKEDVVEWLMVQCPGLSRVSAEAIDRVAMPFSRGK
jgi:hypothetical protein